MTFKERLAAEHPERIGDRYIAGALDCPHSYGYEEYFEAPCQYMSCEECWNREENIGGI